MSRVIVKNLPGKVTEKRLRELFSECGEVTDIKLMKTRGGSFRRFGFVGFVSEAQAEATVEHFDKTFIKASRIAVEIAKPYGDKSLTRPWSKYSKGSSANQQWEKRRREKLEEVQAGKGSAAVTSKEKQGERQQRLSQDLRKSKLSKLLGEYCDLESDPQFQEFLTTHKHKSKVHTWADDTTANTNSERNAVVKPSLVSVESKRKGILQTRTHLKVEDDKETNGSESKSEGERDSGAESGSEGEGQNAASTSDMAYLRTKMVKQAGHKERDDSSGSQDANDSSDSGSSDDEAAMSDVRATEEQRPSIGTTPYTLKMRGLPFNATEEDIHTFFYPINVVSIRTTTDNQGRPSGRAYVDFASEADLESALRRNKDCIGRRYIELFRDEGPQTGSGVEREPEDLKPWELKAAYSSGVEEEGIAESGRLFVRNLPFTTTEEHLSDLFGKFGPLAEVTVPLDRNTNKPTGLAFITFMLPEHAVKAYEAQDGQIFQGRLLHLLPAKARAPPDTPSSQQAGPYKKSKEKKLKSQSGSSHNWNTLFLGANAVVDAMAERYSTEKSVILDPESGHSAAVRMALGETQLVSETREFLLSHGVQLDLFEQSRAKRSKTVVLVKNLPFGTTEAEIHQLFSPFGSLGQVVFPPSGISALVVFTEATHAKTAFMKLAYTKFKHLPLYLEWAPMGVMDGKVKEEPAREEKGESSGDAGGEKGDHSTTLFVKNLNFSTTEEALQSHFSRVGKIRTVTIARKRNMKDITHPLSMGFGFVEFDGHELAVKAIKEKQHSELEGHRLELKLSHRETHGPTSARKTARTSEQQSAKILVRNIPFEASKREVKELFRTFGELKTVRLPQKFSTQGEHRGFGFVEFLTREDARRAFEALCHSTHLYGRRLVLEWAEEEESVEALRKRTAEHFHGLRAPGSKRRKAQELLSALDSSRKLAPEED